LFFAAHLIVGLIAYKGYGIAADEPISRGNGRASLSYVRGQIARISGTREPTAAETRLLTRRDRDYGVFVEMPLAGLEHALGLEDSRQIYLMRHLATFVLFWSAVIAFFFLAKGRYDSWQLALVGSALLILTPRIFAHSFFNSKDIGFLSVFVFAMFTLRRFWLDRSALNASLHACASAAAITTRIGGVLIPVLTVLVIGPELLCRSSTRRLAQRTVGLVALYATLTALLTIALWPYLWQNPVGNFSSAFEAMSSFRWGGDVLFMGSFVPATELPWFYVPVWLVITVPVMYLLLFGVGSGSLLSAVWKSHFRITCRGKDHEDLIYLAIFLIPIVSAIALKSVLYDGWRHLFFVYPAFLLVALRGFAALLSGFKSSSAAELLRYACLILLGALGVSSVASAYWIGQNHPHQNVYFNVLAGDDVGRNFELDYWGLSYRQGLEHLLRTDDSPVIELGVASYPGRLNQSLLEEADRKRLRYVEPGEGKYFLSNHRFELEHDKYVNAQFPYSNLLWSIEVGSGTIMGAYAVD
jgi:hypothetical protein